MAERRIHNATNDKRRGEGLPARLRFAVHRGTTLVELMIAMLILTIVCIAWLEIIGIQSARKEARRREAVERLAGMMDAFIYLKRQSADVGYYYMMTNVLAANSYQLMAKKTTEEVITPMYDESVSPIGYRLRVVQKLTKDISKDLSDWDLFSGDWISKRWLVGLLYDRNGTLTDSDKPFFTLPVCLGFKP